MELTPKVQKEIVKELVKKNLLLINTGHFFVDGKYYVLNIEIKEITKGP